MSDDDMEDFECPGCGLRFNVIWQRDAMSIIYERQISWCPRCGENLEADDDD